MTAIRLSGVVLAAGSASRFGADKLVQPLPTDAHGVAAGTALAVASWLHLRTVIPDSIVVVRDARAASARLLAQAGAVLIECPNADEGMGASLAAGVAGRSDADGWLIALGDMPWIAPASIGLVAAALRSGASIAATRYAGQRGHPVGFSRAHRDALLALRGDAGARDIVSAYRDETVLVDVDDPGVVRDVDLPDDLKD